MRLKGFGAVEGGEGNWKGRNLAQYLLISSLFMEAVTDQRHKFKALVIKYNIDNASIPMTLMTLPRVMDNKHY